MDEVLVQEFPSTFSKALEARLKIYCIKVPMGALIFVSCHLFPRVQFGDRPGDRGVEAVSLLVTFKVI